LEASSEARRRRRRRRRRTASAISTGSPERTRSSGKLSWAS
jgi:hypothetical protein